MKNSEPTTALETLGTILSTEEMRDAIHLAVVPVVASARVYPGQHLNADGGTTPPLVGIADPFLPGPAQPGQRFWLVLYPRTITSLRHVWTHPAFPETPADSKEKSERWLRDYADREDVPPYEELISMALDAYDGMYTGGMEYSGHIPDEFWHHVEVVTGRRISKRADYFRCAC